MKNEDNPKLLWTPDSDFVENSNLKHYMDWLKNQKSLQFTEYQTLWQWSVDQPEPFWESLWQYFNIESHSDYTSVLSGTQMPHYEWFVGASLNFAEHVFHKSSDERPAIIFKQEGQQLQQISWKELSNQVLGLQNYLKNEVDLRPGDRVVGYLPNAPEAIVALLAVVSLGGVWSSCSPDFGVSSVIDRFAQVEPKVFIAADGYAYGGKSFDKSKVVEEVTRSLTTVDKVIIIPYLGDGRVEIETTESIIWPEALLDQSGQLEFVPVSFSHPMWVLYSSGTTGIPKAITHSQGGILMEHLKYLTFHNNVKEGDRCFWYT
ncbi:MAG: AMP-binding protein, partial [Fulvivirga sp.]|nr:AMP-binding protein [Fulvivirga sp.]